MFTLTEVCRELSISPATGRNWIKLGKIKAEGKRGNAYVFTEDYVKRLKEELKSGERKSLKSRRNKIYVSGNSLYREYVSESSPSVPEIENLIKSISDSEFLSEIDSIGSDHPETLSMLGRAILSDCAIRMIIWRTYPSDEANQIIRECIISPLYDYLNHDLSIGPYDNLINDIILSPTGMQAFLLSQPELPQANLKYEPGEDILGLLYLSLKNIGHRKKNGAYYTPTGVVKKLLGHLYSAVLITDGLDKTILDPCCGTGNFLLQLPPGIPVENIYGCDIDKDSVKISRLNLALKYNQPDNSFWSEHITCSDFLSDTYDSQKKNYDIILGNPPWGYDFTQSETAAIRKKFETARNENPESYDLFCEQGIKHLNEGGYMSFVLPESILTVKSHMPVRSFLLKNTYLTHLQYLGEVFDRVQCPSIILQVKKGVFSYEKIPQHNTEFLKENPVVYEGGRHFTIEKDRLAHPECFDFLIPKEEYSLLRKIETLPGAFNLKNNCIFALGIVTGANKDMLKSRKSSKNEIILKGSDIFRFRFRIPKCYINYRPELCQQTAPIEYYRADEKLLYRFIGNRLVFAYDNKQTLSLNSCNILIPKVKDYGIKYIMAILNSRILDYYFKKRFRSVKVLRSHIEQLPIPAADIITRQRIEALSDRLISGDTRTEEIYNLLDLQIAELFGLDNEEYSAITEYLSNDCFVLQD